MVRRDAIKIGVLRIEGTNSEDETAQAFRELGAKPEIVHMNQLDASKVPMEDFRRIEDYHGLIVPGGFSAGDYIRAGAIWAARLKAKHGKDLEAFVAEGKPIGGLCNGFQVLVETGLLPDLGHKIMSHVPEAVLSLNESAHYECRPVLLRNENRGSCAFTKTLKHGEVRTLIASHGEGKLLFARDRQDAILRELVENDQIVFRYVDPEGNLGGYPWNPNGAPGNVAGITNREGNVFGMMPHPERIFHRYNHPDWTRALVRDGTKPDGLGDGAAVLESMLRYIEAKL
ncbi:MAG: phosphoribosylformylglycinamidine synthase subunit PurQ [Thermoplasmatota archaeon]